MRRRDVRISGVGARVVLAHDRRAAEPAGAHAVGDGFAFVDVLTDAHHHNLSGASA